MLKIGKRWLTVAGIYKYIVTHSFYKCLIISYKLGNSINSQIPSHIQIDRGERDPNYMETQYYGKN